MSSVCMSVYAVCVCCVYEYVCVYVYAHVHVYKWFGEGILRVIACTSHTRVR